jgi:hypothetical protein
MAAGERFPGFTKRFVALALRFFLIHQQPPRKMQGSQGGFMQYARKSIFNLSASH